MEYFKYTIQSLYTIITKKFHFAPDLKYCAIQFIFKPQYEINVCCMCFYSSKSIIFTFTVYRVCIIE